MFLTKYNTPLIGRVSYGPSFSEIESLIDRLFNYEISSFSNRLNLNETESQWSLTLELPGFAQKDIEVSVEEKILYVKAKNDKKETSRELSLWDGIDFDRVSGTMSNGLLTVTLPKLEKIKPRKIEIK